MDQSVSEDPGDEPSTHTLSQTSVSSLDQTTEAHNEHNTVTAELTDPATESEIQDHSSDENPDELMKCVDNIPIPAEMTNPSTQTDIQEILSNKNPHKLTKCVGESPIPAEMINPSTQTEIQEPSEMTDLASQTEIQGNSSDRNPDKLTKCVYKSPLSAEMTDPATQKEIQENSSDKNSDKLTKCVESSNIPAEIADPVVQSEIQENSTDRNTVVFLNDKKLNAEFCNQSIPVSHTNQLTDLPKGDAIPTSDKNKSFNAENIEPDIIRLTDLDDLSNSSNEQQYTPNDNEIQTSLHIQNEIQDSSSVSHPVAPIRYDDTSPNSKTPSNTDINSDLQDNSTDAYQIKLTNCAEKCSTQTEQNDSDIQIEMEENSSAIQSNESKNVLNAYEIHRHLEPSCTQPSIHQVEYTKCIDNSSLRTEKSDKDIKNMIHENASDNIQNETTSSFINSEIQGHSSDKTPVILTECVGKSSTQTKMTDSYSETEIQKNSNDLFSVEQTYDENSRNIHPVQLTKCVDNSSKPFQMPDKSNMKIVDLMDFSSIDELKRLWEKPADSLKKPKQINKTGEFKSYKMSETENKDLTKYTVSETISEDQQVNTDLKSCGVRVERVEHVSFESSTIKVDLTLPNTPYTSPIKIRGRPPKSKQTNQSPSKAKNSKVVKKLGRPPLSKEKVESPSSPGTAALSKKRGRPPMSKQKVNYQNNQDTVSLVKKRGRPPIFNKLLEQWRMQRKGLVEQKPQPPLPEQTFSNNGVLLVNNYERSPLFKQSPNNAETLKKGGRPPLYKKIVESKNIPEIILDNEIPLPLIPKVEPQEPSELMPSNALEQWPFCVQTFEPPNTPDVVSGKKRGRPPTPKHNVQSPTSTLGAPKKRGRPPLLKQTVQSLSTPEVVPKRKRGRPPMLNRLFEYWKIQNKISIKQLGRPPLPKQKAEFPKFPVKKLGRPPLSSPTAKSPNTSEVKKRGRPPLPKQNVESPKTLCETPVKKRGRPPLSKPTFESPITSKVIQIKKLGRPPLSKPITGFTNSPGAVPAKKRGRPPMVNKLIEYWKKQNKVSVNELGPPPSSKQTVELPNTEEIQDKELEAQHISKQKIQSPNTKDVVSLKKRGRPPKLKGVDETSKFQETAKVKKRGRPPLIKQIVKSSNTTKYAPIKKRGRPPLSKKTVEKVTDHVTKSYGLKCTKEKQNITEFVMKALDNVAQKHPSEFGQDRNINNHLENIDQNCELSAELNLQHLENVEQDELDECNKLISKAKASGNRATEYSEFNEERLFDEVDLDLEDSGDEYIPSDDEYHPLAANRLRYAFTNTKRKKFVYKKIPGKKKQTENEGEVARQMTKIKEEPDSESDSDILVQKRGYKRRNYGKRIGRPPTIGIFECQNCPYVAKHKAQLDRHARVHFRPILQCSYCDKTFKATNPLLEHEARVHNRANPFKCHVDGCEYASKCKQDLIRHQSKHLTEKIYTCELCGWRTKWVRNLRSHRLMKHSDERKFKCPQCPFLAKRNSDLKQHIYRHNEDKPLQCLTCGFMVKTNWELRSHMLTHSDHKPFKCDFPGCTAATKTNADLTKHKRRHLTERNFICDVCGKGYKCRTSLQKHKAIHVQTRDFECEKCGRKFKTKPTLRKHMSFHSGIKPFKCEVCHMAFTMRSNLVKHSETHDTTTRPFICPLCPHAAKQQDHLLAHIGAFHGKSYTYFCEFCKKPFHRFGQLKMHYRRMHPDIDVNGLFNFGSLTHALSDVSSKNELGMESRDGETRVKIEPPWTNDEESVGYDTVIKEELRETSLSKSHSEQETMDFLSTTSNAYRKDMGDTTPHKSSSSDVQDSSTSVNDSSENNLNQSNQDRQNFDVNMTAPLICSSEASKVAVYDGFRLPLATKGFEFNYEKSGKKPNAWFMDVTCMKKNRDMEKQKKYLRRIGILPPLSRGLGKGPRGPRGPRKQTLTDFVNRRKKKLEENIRKSNFIKEYKEAMKLNSARRARFQGNYNELEGIDYVEENEFVQTQVEEKVTEKSLDSSSKPKQIRKKAKEQKSIHSEKNTGKRMKKKTVSQKKPKLLLSSEKKRKVKKTDIDIRKPAFLQKHGAAEKTNKKQPKTTDSCKTCKKRGRPPKLQTKTVEVQSGKTKSASKKTRKESVNEKRKYTKKYVPVKQKKVKENTKCAYKKSDSPKKTGSQKIPKSSKKNNSPSKKQKRSKGDYPKEIPSEFVIAPEPPLEIKMSHTEAALMNEHGTMLDRAIILQSESGHYYHNHGGFTYTGIATGTQDWNDSGVVEDFTGDSKAYYQGQTMGVKHETYVDHREASSMAFVIMEADSGTIKDQISVPACIMTNDGGADDGNGIGGVKIKEEPLDDF